LVVDHPVRADHHAKEIVKAKWRDNIELAIGLEANTNSVND
jgi:hypothetical protein